MASIPDTRTGLSLEAFLELPEINRRPYLEYIDGRVVEKVSPKRKHSAVQIRFGSALNDVAYPEGIGQAFTELRCTFAGRSIIPDVVFHLEEHIEVDAAGEMVDDVSIPPDIHIEIVSPRQTERLSGKKTKQIGALAEVESRTADEFRAGLPSRLLMRLMEDPGFPRDPSRIASERDARDTLKHSTSHGCSIGWLLNPQRRTIDEYRPGQDPRRLPEDGILDGAPVLPGFRLPVAEVWGWMRRRRRGDERGGPA